MTNELEQGLEELAMGFEALADRQGGPFAKEFLKQCAEKARRLKPAEAIEMASGKVVGLDGKNVDTNNQPDGALLDAARVLMDEVRSGEVKQIILITTNDDGDLVHDPVYQFYGKRLTLIGILDRCKHKINLSLDGTLDDDGE